MGWEIKHFFGKIRLYHSERHEPLDSPSPFLGWWNAHLGFLERVATMTNQLPHLWPYSTKNDVEVIHSWIKIYARILDTLMECKEVESSLLKYSTRKSESLNKSMFLTSYFQTRLCLIQSKMYGACIQFSENC